MLKRKEKYVQKLETYQLLTESFGENPNCYHACTRQHRSMDCINFEVRVVHNDQQWNIREAAWNNVKLCPLRRINDEYKGCFFIPQQSKVL
jgi:hypothetical protein